MTRRTSRESASLVGSVPADKLHERVWSLVSSRPSGCWVWTGRTDGCGYGMAYVADYNWRVHRLAYSLLVGDIPDGLQLDHLCRNRKCCNPDHLEPVPQRTNVLRGIGWGAQNKRKTHCPSGHAYDETNTYVDSTGRRRCRPCRNARRRVGAA